MHYGEGFHSIPVVVLITLPPDPYHDHGPKQIEDGLRMQKVQAIIEAANQQFAAKDYGACLASIENGLRIDAGA